MVLIIIIINFFKVLLSVLSDMLMCGLITDPMDTSIAQWAIKIIENGKDCYMHMYIYPVLARLCSISVLKF